MGVAHIAQVLRQLVAQDAVVHKAVLVPVALEALFPGTQVALVNRHGLFQHFGVVPAALVLPVAPLVVVKAADDGGVVRPLLKSETVGVALIALDAVGARDQVAVGVALPHVGEEALPHAVLGALHPLLVLPARGRGDQRHRLRVGRPDHKAGPPYAVFLDDVRAHFFVNLVVCALME